MSKFDDYAVLDGIMLELTGQTMEESDGDVAGTYFSREHWVSADAIGEALVLAYQQGVSDAKAGAA